MRAVKRLSTITTTVLTSVLPTRNAVPTFDTNICCFFTKSPPLISEASGPLEGHTALGALVGLFVGVTIVCFTLPLRNCHWFGRYFGIAARH